MVYTNLVHFISNYHDFIALCFFIVIYYVLDIIVAVAALELLVFCWLDLFCLVVCFCLIGIFFLWGAFGTHTKVTSE